MNESSKPLVSIVSVNYNTSGVTLDMIKSLKESTYQNIEIIVVDNGSPNDTPDIIKEKFPDIIYIKSQENLGFAGGNNLGVKEASGKYILFLNTDTEVEPNFLEPMVELFESNPKIGVVSPKLIYYYSENKKTIQYAGANGINPYSGRGAKIGFKAIDDGSFNDTRETSLAHGAAMMVSREVIETVGLMPDIYFLYYEEHDWAEMIKRAGYKIYYQGKSKVFHKESISVGKANPLKVYYMTRNRIIYLRRNTSFSTFIVSFMFFCILSIPKNTFKYLLKRQFKFLSVFYRGFLWNFTNYNVKITPKLSQDNHGRKIIINASKNNKAKI